MSGQRKRSCVLCPSATVSSGSGELHPRERYDACRQGFSSLIQITWWLQRYLSLAVSLFVVYSLSTRLALTSWYLQLNWKCDGIQTFFAQGFTFLILFLWYDPWWIGDRECYLYRL